MPLRELTDEEKAKLGLGEPAPEPTPAPAMDPDVAGTVAVVEGREQEPAREGPVFRPITGIEAVEMERQSQPSQGWLRVGAEASRRVVRGMLGPLADPVSRLTGGQLASPTPVADIPAPVGQALEYGGTALSLGAGAVGPAARAVGQLGPAAARTAQQVAAGQRAMTSGAMTTARDVGSRFIGEVAETAMTRPGTFWGLELGSAAGAGAAGGSLPEDASPTTRLLVETGGALVGSLVPSAARTTGQAIAALPTSRMITAAARQVLQRDAPIFKRRAGERVQDLAGQSGRETIKAADKARAETVPGAPLTLSELAEDDGLLTLQRAVAKSTDELKEAERQRFAEINQMSRDYLAGPVEGAENVPPETVSQYLATLVDERIRIARAAVDEKLAGLGPRATREDANRLARVELNNAYDNALAQETELWDKVPGDVRGHLAHTHDALEAQLRRFQEGDRVAAGRRDVPTPITRHLGRLVKDEEGDELVFKVGDLGGEASARELQTLRSELQDIAARERAKPAPNRRKLSIIQQTSDAILADLEAIDSAGAFDIARTFSRDLNQRFRQGEVGDILGFEVTREGSVPTSLTLESTLGKSGMSGAEAADQLANAVQRSGNPEAMAAHVQDFILDEFRRAAVRDGQLNPRAAAAYLNRRQDLLNRFPETRRRLEEAVRLGDAAVATEGITAPSQSAAAVVLKAPPGREARAIISARDPKATAQETWELLQTDKTGRAMEGFRQTLLKEIMDTSQAAAQDAQGVRFLSGAKLAETLGTPGVRAALERFATPEMRDRLGRVVATLVKSERSRRTKPAGEVLTDKEAIFERFARRVGAAALGRRLGDVLGARGQIQITGMSVELSDKLAERGIDPAHVLLTSALTSSDDTLLRTLLMTGPAGPERQRMVNRQLDAWAAKTAAEYGIRLSEQGDDR